MAGLQEDSSLVNLLNLGGDLGDLYVIDWDNPSRADRWLPLVEYIDDSCGGADTKGGRQPCTSLSTTTIWQRSRAAAAQEHGDDPCY